MPASTSVVTEKPLRILQIVSSSATSGAERQLVVLARLLREVGHSIEVICPPREWMVDALVESGIPTHAVDFKASMGLAGLGKVRRIVREGKFDLVHAHLSRATYMGAVAAGLQGIPLISTVHVETREPLYRFIARGNNRIVAVSNFIRGVLCGRGVRDEFIDVVYNGTDFADVSYERGQAVHGEFSIPEDRRLVGLVGRVAPEKGHMVAIDALPRVLDEAPDVHLMFVGREQGEFPDDLRRRADHLRVADRVTFTGNRQDVPRLFDAMDLSILPSVMEACPLAVIECMARGKPVVASRVGGIQELVVHQETGLLVEQNADAFASGMSYLLTHPHDLERMGRNAQDLIREKFTLHRNVEMLEAVYHRALAPKPKR